MGQIVSIWDCDCRTEWVQRVCQKRVVAGDETPFVFLDVVYFTGHVIITTNYENLVLNKEWFMANS